VAETRSKFDPYGVIGALARPSVASIGDLARMASAVGGEQHLAELRQLRRLDELERGRTRSIER
jgi:hypothetical protein